MELPVLSFDLEYRVRDIDDPGQVGCVLTVSFAGHEVDQFPVVATEYWLERDINRTTAEAVKEWLIFQRTGVLTLPSLEGWKWDQLSLITAGRWVSTEEK